VALNVGIGQIVTSGIAIQLPHLPFRRLDHVEIYEPCIEIAKKTSWLAGEVNYFHCDAKDFEHYGDYELVLLFDVLEHLPKENGLAILKKCKHVLAWVPIDKVGGLTQNENYGVHLSAWGPEDFDGYKVEVLQDFYKWPDRTFSAMWAAK
jgi:hypothetical protein